MHYGVHHYTKRLSLIHVSYFILFLFFLFHNLCTSFLDILFTKSGTDYMLPTPAVITNYQTITSTFPNQNCEF
jgi:hypothetical protein